MPETLMPDPQIIPDLETSRFHLRHWSVADAGDLHAAFGDAECMRYWDCPPTRDLAATEAFIHNSRAVSPRFHAALAIARKDDGRVVGMVN